MRARARRHAAEAAAEGGFAKKDVRGVRRQNLPTQTSAFSARGEDSQLYDCEKGYIKAKKVTVESLPAMAGAAQKMGFSGRSHVS